MKTDTALQLLRDMLRRELIEPLVAEATAAIQRAAKEDLGTVPPSKELLTTDEAARLLRISPRTLRDWVQKGRIEPCGRGRTYLFDRQEVLDAVRRRPRRRRAPRRGPSVT